MALINAESQAVNGRPFMGTKAINTPVMAAKKARGNLMMARIGSRTKTKARTSPAASCRNCLSVMSPTSRNS